MTVELREVRHPSSLFRPGGHQLPQFLTSLLCTLRRYRHDQAGHGATTAQSAQRRTTARPARDGQDAAHGRSRGNAQHSRSSRARSSTSTSASQSGLCQRCSATRANRSPVSSSWTRSTPSAAGGSPRALGHAHGGTSLFLVRPSIRAQVVEPDGQLLTRSISHSIAPAVWTGKSKFRCRTSRYVWRSLRSTRSR